MLSVGSGHDLVATGEDVADDCDTLGAYELKRLILYEAEITSVVRDGPQSFSSFTRSGHTQV